MTGSPSGNAPERPPTRTELLAAYDRTVPDLLGPGMSVLLVGINPSLWSGYAGYHFARPANRLWRTLYEAGFTERPLHPSETEEVRGAGIGITNLVRRATARADEISPDEIRAGVARLRRIVRTWQPPHVAFLGVTAYRIAFNAPKATVGPQPEPFVGSRVWLLPNPSGLNAHYQQPQLTAVYAEVRGASQQR